MPAKNTIAKFHGRHPFLNRKLWRKYVKQTGNKIDYTQFKAIVEASIDEVKNWALKDPGGFMLPGRAGHIAINKFKTYGNFRTYTGLRTPEGKAIRNFNLHTGGDTFRIQWFRNTRSFSERFPFWYFEASREFKRRLAKVLKNGRYPLYNSFMQDHFTSNHKD